MKLSKKHSYFHLLIIPIHAFQWLLVSMGSWFLAKANRGISPPSTPLISPCSFGYVILSATKSFLVVFLSSFDDFVTTKISPHPLPCLLPAPSPISPITNAVSSSGARASSALPYFFVWVYIEILFVLVYIKILFLV